VVRDRLDEGLEAGPPSLEALAHELGTHPSQLVRAFRHE
jgi:AraC-like DNA-binding protein